MIDGMPEDTHQRCLSDRGMLTEGADLMEQRSGSAPYDRQTEVKSTDLAPADHQLFLKHRLGSLKADLAANG